MNNFIEFSDFIKTINILNNNKIVINFNKNKSICYWEGILPKPIKSEAEIKIKHKTKDLYNIEVFYFFDNRIGCTIELNNTYDNKNVILFLKRCNNYLIDKQIKLMNKNVYYFVFVFENFIQYQDFFLKLLEYLI
jgi:hypothetical protein